MDCENYDTFEAMIMERINRSLRTSEFAALDNGIDKWDNLYLKFFLNVYVQLCKLPGIRYRVLDMLTFEPVILQSDVRISKHNEPTIIHGISIPYLQAIFNLRNKVEVSTKNCASSMRLPSIFPTVGTSDGGDNYVGSASDSRVLSKTLSTRLLNFYVHADHAAYHFNQFIKTGDAGYDHEDIRTRKMPLKPREVKYCHDLISSIPNKHLTDYLKSHDVLRIEDVAVSNSHCSNFGSIFTHNSDSSDNE